MKTHQFKSRRTQHQSAAASRENESLQSVAATAADPRRRLQGGIDSSPRVQDQHDAIQAAFGNALQRRSAGLEDDGPQVRRRTMEEMSGPALQRQAAELDDEEAIVQGRFGGAPAAVLQAQAEPGSAPPAVSNQTGMPDSLKAGMESLSGMDMSEVRVHRNSGRPAQLNALAYAQGNEIHLAPGQEQHLQHEAWHVVQQRQGRVQPTVQVAGVQVNDDVGLEREADAMGAAAQLFRQGESQDSAQHLMAPAPHEARSSSPPAQRYVDVEDPTTWTSVRRAEAAELARYLTREGGNLTDGQVAWVREVTERWGTDYEVRTQLMKAQLAKGKSFSIPDGQPNGAAVAILDWLQKNAPTKRTSPVHDEHASIDFDADEPAIKPVSRSQPRAATASSDPVKVKKSTINFSESMLLAAPLVGLGSKDLESRNPHTKLGTGSSGTQHDVADGKASIRARKLVEGAILAKTGANMSAQDFLKLRQSEEVTRAARDEKKSAAAQKMVEKDAADWEDFCSWIAVLAPQAWRDLQEQRGNTVRRAPPDKKHKALLAKATKEQWPMEWDDSLSRYLEG